MALDTNLTPEGVNSYNTYINGNKAIGVTSEISMPTITFPALASSARFPPRTSASLNPSNRRSRST